MVHVYRDDDPTDRGFTHADCVQGPHGCKGQVEYRYAISGSGVSYPRCDGHWADRLEVDQKHREIYPDSDTPPAWFDPSYAGERWNDDY